MSVNPQNSDTLRWHQRLALELLWGMCCTIGAMPRWFKYGMFQPFVYALLRTIRYRYKVMHTNISLSFPEKSEKEVKQIIKGAYSNLAEVIVDTICLAGAKRRNDLDHITWIDADKHIERNKDRDWIFMASHYGCWEYFLLWTLIDPNRDIIGVYHPLKSVVFEHFYRRLRSFEPSVAVVPMKETVRHYIKHRSSEHTTVLGLISDQSPRLTAESQWIDFLNQKTIFIEGSERLAMKFKIPVYFVVTERICLGRYRISFIEIYDGKEPIKEGDITRRYAEELEKMIRRTPELWMWSHKRWKHTPEKQAAKFGESTLR